MTHAATRLKGDDRVNVAIDNKIARESQYTRKKSVTVYAESVYTTAFNDNCVQGAIPGTTPENPPEGELLLDLPVPDLPIPDKFITAVKEDVKTTVLVEDNLKTFEHVQTLVKQGKFLQLSKLEETDATWKSYIYNLPKGTMKWLLNSTIDTLPTKVNLKQWGKVTNDKCFCQQRQTLNHILNCCKTSLNQGRYTMRHDSVLNYVAQCVELCSTVC